VLVPVRRIESVSENFLGGSAISSFGFFIDRHYDLFNAQLLGIDRDHLV